jgi:hypothetical protein
MNIQFQSHREGTHWLLIAMSEQTGHYPFKCGNIEGMAKEENDSLEILAIISNKPGQGELRQFIEDANQKYNRVTFLELWSDVLEQALIRYGFKKDSPLPNYTWSRP